MKIVSLLPSATEIVFALGLEDSLEGVTFECDHPPAAATKPVVSRPSIPFDEAAPGEIDSAVSSAIANGQALYSIDEDLIRAIQPDLILAQDLCRVCAVPSGQVTDALDKLGCTSDVISLDPSTVDQVISGIEVVARSTGVAERGDALAGALRARVARVREAAAGIPPTRTLFLEWPDPLFNGGHWVPEMVGIAGGRDVVGVAGAPSRRIGWDEVASGAPDAVIYSPCGFGLEEAVAQAPDLFAIPEFASTPAARVGRVFAVDATSFFSRPGPRIVDGIEILAWALHPELFDPPAAGSIAPVGP